MPPTSLHSDDSIDRAFALAFFIVPEKTAALEIVASAFASLEVMASVQERRKRYLPSLRRLADGTRRQAQRNRVCFARPHLLQRLIYRHSEAHEEGLEAAARPPERRDLLVRYVKHLVRITLRRNSFYLTLGLGRLLHRYDTEETMSLYSLLVQDPDRSRDNDFCRAVKQRLHKDLEKRFGAALQWQRGVRGEKTLVADSDGSGAPIVVECLRRFVPWDTSCVVPERFDPLAEEIDALGFRGPDPDEEHAVEVRRIHSLLHPECFSRLVLALGLQPPQERLLVPRFQHAAPPDSSEPPEPPSLEPGDRGALQAGLVAAADRRRHILPDQLRLEVDGTTAASVDLTTSSRARCPLPRDAELLEVWGRSSGEDSLLAALFLSELTLAGPRSRFAVTLEGGQRILFTVHELEEETLDIELLYRETHPQRALRGAWRHFWRRGRGWIGSPRRALRGLASLAALATAMFFLVPRKLSIFDQPVRPAEEVFQTRGDSEPSGTESLRGVWKILVGAPSDAPPELVEALTEGLETRGLLAPDPEQTDAVLKLENLGNGAQEWILVSRRGEVLWRSRRQAGDTRESAEKLLADLAQALRGTLSATPPAE